MGNVFSSGRARERSTVYVISESEMNNESVSSDDGEENDLSTLSRDTSDESDRAKAKEEEMNEFRKQLNIKREQRKEILARHRTEKEKLEKSLQSERALRLQLYESNKQLRGLLQEHSIAIPKNLQSAKENSELTEAVVRITEEFEIVRSSNQKLRRDLAETNNALQRANSDIADLNSQNIESMKQINALKEVVSVSKTMINLREDQLSELKNKLCEIEQTLADKETNLLSADLRKEYERQLQNIRTLRGLYEERARLAEVSRQGLVRDLEEHKLLYQAEVNKCKDLTNKVDQLEVKVEELQETIQNKNLQISSCQDETNGLKAEMAVVNKLFSQVLLGYKTKQDLDKLVYRLEENHGILTHMAEKENGSETSSALPKLLLELVSQVDDAEENGNFEQNHENDLSPKNNEERSIEQVSEKQNTTPEEIVENLPKVWRVLMELLSHQTVPEENPTEKVTTCYKSVETKSGPVLVPSVSQTYIRLKDLIVEKLGLIKEVNRMKQLNSHLESRLGEQERRLCLVTTELSKTWHVVSRLRRHHHQLHTHEKIMKYELQQKRKLLNELKEELEYCREKWEQAREKNTQSEKDWKKLRAEFSSRKAKLSSPSFNNSAESGYSDERPSDESSESNDESEYVAEPLVRCKKKIKKSFETIMDSSTDFNLAAEREDPASDMLDVAELPLDVQDCENNHELLSDITTSENIIKSERCCDETEDEICDIAHNDSCVESAAEDPYDNDTRLTTNVTRVFQNINNEQSQCDDKHISQNIIEQKPVATGESSVSLTESSSSLQQNTHRASEICEQTNNTPDHLIDRPTGSNDNINILTEPPPLSASNEEVFVYTNIDTEVQQLECRTDTESSHTPQTKTLINQDATASNELPEPIVNVSSKCNLQTDDVSTSNILKFVSTDNQSTPTIDFKAILQNIKNQNERLAMKDERLENLEANCSYVVKNLSSTLNFGDQIIQKLDSLHNGQNISRIDSQETLESSEESLTVALNSEPSTSTEIDHEARFAARDRRLKLLEEQTKSLVDKVNNTTTKGVKIHYKLQELHNIYGSENSRAGTPSDNDDKTNEDEKRSE